MNGESALEVEQDDSDPEPRRPVIDNKTLVPIYAVAAVLMLCYGFLNYLDDRFKPVDGIAANVVEIGHRLDMIEAVVSDRWTATHQKMWELQMRQMNPSIAIPNTWEITGRRP